MEDLLARIVTIVDDADNDRPGDDETTDEDDSRFVDVDFDAYQEIHQLLREAGLLKVK
jgi:hypothetical protein